MPPSDAPLLTGKWWSLWRQALSLALLVRVAASWTSLPGAYLPKTYRLWTARWAFPSLFLPGSLYPVEPFRPASPRHLIVPQTLRRLPRLKACPSGRRLLMVDPAAKMAWVVLGSGIPQRPEKAPRRSIRLRLSFSSCIHLNPSIPIQREKSSESRRVIRKVTFPAPWRGMAPAIRFPPYGVSAHRRQAPGHTASALRPR